jgi:hypothetical protein
LPEKGPTKRRRGGGGLFVEQTERERERERERTPGERIGESGAVRPRENAIARAFSWTWAVHGFKHLLQIFLVSFFLSFYLVFIFFL